MSFGQMDWRIWTNPDNRSYKTDIQSDNVGQKDDGYYLFGVGAVSEVASRRNHYQR